MMRITMCVRKAERILCVLFSFIYMVCHAIGWANYRMHIEVLEHPVQTLQLNTRLSNKSWVGYYGYPQIPQRSRRN